MSISHYNGAWFNVLHTHIGKLRRNFRARWETVMPREKRSLFFEMWCFLCSFLVTVECYSIMVSQKEVHVHVTQPSRIGSVGSVLRGKDENIFWIFFFYFISWGEAAQGNDFHNVIFSNRLCSISTVKRVTHVQHLSAFVVLKNLRFSAFFIYTLKSWQVLHVDGLYSMQ